MQDITQGRVGASTTGYGFPFSWLQKVTIVYPDSPTNYNLSPLDLLMDFAFWSFTIGVLIILIWLKPRISSLQSVST